ncbi:hypothetical protein ACUSIJ_02710 [Pseudochelatococcus sp. B33]
MRGIDKGGTTGFGDATRRIGSVRGLSRRGVVMAAGAVLTPLVAVGAGAADDAGSFLRAVYGLYEKRRNWQGVAFTPDLRARYFSADLTRIWTGMESDFDKAGLVGPIDFDPVTEGHGEAPVTNLVIGKPAIVGDRAQASVSLRQGGARTALVLSLKREADGWRIDDIAQPAGPHAWELRKMLAEAYRAQFGTDYDPGK